MRSILYAGGMVLLWVINLFNGTGLGDSYHTTEYARIAALAVAYGLFLQDGRTQRGYFVPIDYFRTMFPMAILFVLVSLFHSEGLVSLDYLWVFLVTYILSHTRPSQEDLYLVSTAYAVLGLAILYIFNYMTALSGWNPNSVAMIGLFSYLVFTIPYYGIRNTRSMIMITLVGAAYVYLLWFTDSRSCMAAIVLDLLIVFRFVPFERILRANRNVHAALYVPLLVALFGCLLASTADMNELDAWSLEEFGKTLFNGREKVWLSALSLIWDNLLFGTGYVDSGVYHNSAIACLVAYGIVGYGLWIGLFMVILKEALPCRRDICVAGALSAFFVIFWQQSVELGFFSSSPNLIPYLVLGVLLGRVRMLREQ